MLLFLRLRLGTRIGRLCLPAKLAAKPRKYRSQVLPGSESGRNFAYSDRLLAPSSKEGEGEPNRVLAPLPLWEKGIARWAFKKGLRAG
jgi:hypothetical protein